MRSAFFATGLFVALWGITLLFVDQVVFKGQADTTREPGFRGFFTSITPQKQRVVNPPEWAAFGFMSVGAVTMLYSFALPKKSSE